VGAADAGNSVPVIVAVAQLANKDANRLASPLDLAHEAVLRAAAGTPRLLDLVDALYCPPASVFAQRTLADDLGDVLGVAGPRTSASFSGAGPLTMLALACEAVIDGSARVALVAGAVAEASVKLARAQGLEVTQSAPWSQGSAGRQAFVRDDDRHEFRGAETAAGVTSPGEIFALVESSLAHEAGRDPLAQRAWLGELMAPFTKVAASRPELAWFPIVRTAAEISSITPDNRMVAEPYTKRMNSFPMVDLAAALFVTTDSVADELGIDENLRVYPWSTGHCKDVAPPSGRPSMHRSGALRAAIESTLRGARLGVDDVGAFDLYSCFPAAVQLSINALGIDANDARGFTLTGGLPYFGGPGATYVTHAIVSAVERCQGSPNERALVVGVGGAPSDFGATIFAAERPSTPWTIDRCVAMKDVLEAERVAVDNTRHGVATVDAMTVVHDRDTGPVRAPLVARFADGTRCGAHAADASIVHSLEGESLVGGQVRVSQRDGVAVYEPA
jgi:acetyl-CoA C-acetyltransferase